MFHSGVKMVNQLLAGVHIASAAEAMAFGARLGLNTRKLFNVISNCGGTSWYVLLRFCGISFSFLISGRVCGTINGNSISDVHHSDALHNLR